MRILVTGSSGHLGEALVRTLRNGPDQVAGLDIEPGPTTDHVGSVTDAAFVRACMAGAGAVIHTATLHKPHVATHGRQEFVDTNITGTLVCLEAAVEAGVSAFVFTSTTSAFGRALEPPSGEPAAWITEDVPPIPRNIYGVSKIAAEDLCHLVHHRERLPVIILRTSRFFPEQDDRAILRDAYADANIKANEFLFRRVDIEDVVDAHLKAIDRAAEIGFGRYIISATTPFTPDDLGMLRHNAPAVVARRVPGFAAAYARLGWRMFPEIARVYVNQRARTDLGWRPRTDFARVIACLEKEEDFMSPLARAIGAKGYHSETFADGPYPVEET